MNDHDASCGHDECNEKAHELTRMVEFIDSFADVKTINEIDEASRIAIWSAGHLAGVASAIANALNGANEKARADGVISEAVFRKVASEIDEYAMELSITHTYRALVDPALRQHILESMAGVDMREPGEFFNKLSMTPPD